ncbi:MAG: leucine-rich repeat protein, partial [Clostridia bacterium]|nr:leucine-rich repeat protein [Clostridia bacterium]
MKKSLPAALAALLLLTLPLSACFRQTMPSDGTDTGEAVTIPPITIPTEPDDRTFTDTTAYTDRLDTVFATSPLTPAEDFTYETEDGGVRITGYTGGESVVVIPETIEDLPVTVIGEGAFADLTSLRAVSVPDTVTAIGIGAFAGCDGMTSLRTPVFTCHTAPWFGALFGAASYDANGSAVPVSLATLVLTAGEEIPDYAFYACRGLEVVSLPETLREIGAFAFYGCQSLAYITAGQTALTAVGERAFSGCAALLSLELPTTVRTVGVGALEGCGAVESLTLPFVGGYAADYEWTEEDKAAIEEGSMTDPADTAYLGYLFGAVEYTFTAGYLPASLITVTLLEGCGDIPANAFFECSS